MPFTTVVVRNVSDEEGMDDGAKRTFVDLLRNREETNINELSAAVGWLFRWEKGLLHTSGPGSLIPQAEYCRLLELHPKIREHVSYMGSVKSKIGNAGMLAMFRYVFSLSDPERAFTFFEQLASGANLDARSPTLKLRERFIRDKSDKASLLAHEKAALVIVAWKYFKTNKGCGTLEWYYKAKGETDLTLAEQFPKII